MESGSLVPGESTVLRTFRSCDDSGINGENGESGSMGVSGIFLGRPLLGIWHRFHQPDSQDDIRYAMNPQNQGISMADYRCESGIGSASQIAKMKLCTS